MTDEEREQIEIKLRLAQALQLKQQPVAEEETQEKTFGQQVRGAIDYADALAGEFNEGLLSYVPEYTRNFIKENTGIGSEGKIEGPVAEGLQFMGMAAPMVMAPIGTAQAGAKSIGTGFLQRFADDIGNFALSNPALYFGGEAAAAFASGASGKYAEEQGASPLQRLGAEVVAGTVANPLVTALPRGVKATQEAVSANLLPFTEEGGSIRAARQMQERTGGPETAREYAQRLEEIPEGVTPAQWIGDERLLAQEARILADNPALANRVKADLDEARMIAQESLRDSFGRPRTRQQWEISVLEKVVPQGAKVTGNQTDEMLDSAYQAFGPIYDEMKGFDILVDGLGGKISNDLYSAKIIATDDARKSVSRWFNNEASAFNDNVEFDLMPSEDLLALRSRVRDEIRKQNKRQNEEVADLLGAIEGRLTSTLEAGIPEDFARQLQAADSQYRKYKIVEKAIFNAVDDNFTPQDLSRSIQQGGLASQSQYARGANENAQEMRRLALGGRSTSEVLGDPRRARLFVRDLSPDQTKAVQADFANVLFNRAKESSTDIAASGQSYISGRRLKQDLAEQRDVMKSLGMQGGDMARLNKMAETIQTLEKKSPAAVSQLFEDGPASILQLVAALTGAKSGQRLSGGGLGSGLVMAQFMSNKARNTLANLTSDEAERLLVDAATDKKLYQALLTKNVTARNIKERAQYLESWLLASAFDKAQEEDKE